MSKPAQGGWASRGRAKERELIVAYLRQLGLTNAARNVEEGKHLTRGRQ